MVLLHFSRHTELILLMKDILSDLLPSEMRMVVGLINPMKFSPNEYMVWRGVLLILSLFLEKD